jgi:hypothetical protein
MAATMIMWTVPEPSNNGGKHVHQELGDLLETVMVQQAQSSIERWHPETNLVHISFACGTPKGYHTPSMLWPSNDGATHRREPSLARSRYVGNHNARLAQGTRHSGPDLASKDLPYYGESDLDNRGWHPRI